MASRPGVLSDKRNEVFKKFFVGVLRNLIRKIRLFSSYEDVH